MLSSMGLPSSSHEDRNDPLANEPVMVSVSSSRTGLLQMQSFQRGRHPHPEAE